jgi:hypothetical protein
MSVLFVVKGSVTGIGQSKYNTNAEVFAYIEVTEPSGRRVMIEKVVVSTDVGAAFEMGATGELFVDRVFRSGELRCQLWGIKTPDREILDRKNLRLDVSLVQLLYGIVTIPVLGLGLLIAVPALIRLLGCVGEPRRRMFYGLGESRARTPAEQVVRI